MATRRFSSLSFLRSYDPILSSERIEGRVDGCSGPQLQTTLVDCSKLSLALDTGRTCARGTVLCARYRVNVDSVYVHAAAVLDTCRRAVRMIVVRRTPPHENGSPLESQMGPVTVRKRIRNENDRGCKYNTGGFASEIVVTALVSGVFLITVVRRK